MLGLVFTAFGDMVEEQWGMATWNQCLTKAKLSHDGSFTVGERYPDHEMLQLASATAEQLGVPIEFLVRRFGEYLFGEIGSRYGDIIKPFKTTKELLLAVDQVIHQEVVKLHPDAGLPTFTYEDPEENMLVMKYHSARKLCHLAEGLIVAAADHYDQEVALLHTSCLHRGDDHCRLELWFYDK